MNFIKRISLVFATLLLLAGAQVAQAQNPQQQSYLHRVGNLYYALGYSTWQATVLTGNSSTGAGTSITVFAQGANGVVTLADGSAISLASVFNTLTPITIADANQETFTPTSVTLAPCTPGNLGVGSSNQCATVTGTIANLHGASAVIFSGDFGVGEALTDAGNQGGGVVFWQVDTGIVTLSTGGVTTTTGIKVPTNRSSIGCAARVTTTITTSTTWGVGSTASGVSFCSASSTMTAGTTGVATQVAPTSIGTTQALEAVVFTMTGTPGAGAIKARVWGFTTVQPAS